MPHAKRSSKGPTPGRFIAIEGGDGVGKSTFIRSLCDLLTARGTPFLLTREPGGVTESEKIRELLLSPQHKWSALAELFLFEAARVEHLEKVVRPALNNNTWVLCDRFTASTIAYQSFGRGIAPEVVTTCNRIATDGLEPALFIWIHASAETSAKRRASRAEADRLDAETDAFHERVRHGFEHYFKTCGIPHIALSSETSPETMIQTLESHSLWKALHS